MCGITAYLGKRQAAQVLLSGLARLEYRGYDSAGVAIVNDGKLTVEKKVLPCSIRMVRRDTTS